MCGIAAYIGKRRDRNAIQIVMEGIQHLEYRGYDSSGIAAWIDGELYVRKQTGKVADLKQILDTEQCTAHLAVAHTRWATHGKPHERNAHPLFDAANQLVVVHNGIIENFEVLRQELESQGIRFSSETDTEVIAQWIGREYRGDLLVAVQRVVPKLHGAFAIAVLHKAHPDCLIVAAKESPLCLGIGHQETFVASDPNAFLAYTRDVIYLHGCELAKVEAGCISVFDAELMPIAKTTESLGHGLEDISRGEYPHYMIKEIFEQPKTLRHALLSRFSESQGNAIFDEIDFAQRKIDRIIILACGSSYHAGLIGAQMIEEWARIPVQVEVSSEFRYRNPIIFDATLVIAISQSGETADTLAAMRELREKGAAIVGICNAQNSTLAREVDATLFLRAGPEIGVASTKAFTSQLAVLALIALKLGRMRGRSLDEGQHFVKDLIALPSQIETILIRRQQIQQIAQDYASYQNFFYLGRRYMFPTALEGALKLKEIAYINANGYAAGEMKHGPISLIDEDCPTVACLCDAFTVAKMKSNLREVKARDGRVLAIAFEDEEVPMADDLLYVPRTRDELAPILVTVVTQLLAYEIARCRGCEIDQPRNLAKSVTVE